jgi:hypothetical protein
MLVALAVSVAIVRLFWLVQHKKLTFVELKEEYRNGSRTSSYPRVSAELLNGWTGISRFLNGKSREHFLPVS